MIPIQAFCWSAWEYSGVEKISGIAEARFRTSCAMKPARPLHSHLTRPRQFPGHLKTGRITCASLDINQTTVCQRQAASSRVSCAAGISLHPVAFWPDQSGEKSPEPTASAFARKGTIADVASGKAGGR